jgi:cyclic pyranopterin monophosphate synthase
MITSQYAHTEAIIQFNEAACAEILLQKDNEILAMSKAAALLAMKKTSDVIPNLPHQNIEFSSVIFSLEGLQLKVTIELKSIGKTSLEVAAMYGATVAALSVFDALKSYDENIQITHIKCIEKQKKPSEMSLSSRQKLKVAVVVCSDSISAGEKEDQSGKAIMAKLNTLQIPVLEYLIIADDSEMIKNKILQFVDNQYDMIIFTGGTGLSKRDITPETIRPLLDREIPGIAETIRNYGQERTPYSMLSRSVAGFIQETLILALPGSTKGATESMDAIFPHVLHVFRVLKGGKH